MRRAAAAICVLALAAGGAVAQERVNRGTGAVLRALDKITTEIRDLDLAAGEAALVGSLRVRLDQCRYPADNPAGDAFARVVIDETETGEILFDGWMLASSPALNALEHPRYDVWVMRCTT
jgi:hypothetical protein